jgi:hypothetical protein
MGILILDGRSNDLDKCKAQTAFKSINNFIILNNHMNVILLSILQCHGLQNHTYK